MLLDHENRSTRLEETCKHILHVLERIESEIKDLRAEQTALRESVDRNIAALREEFRLDRRFSAMVFLTTQLAVIGALLRLAGIL